GSSSGKRKLGSGRETPLVPPSQHFGTGPRQSLSLRRLPRSGRNQGLPARLTGTGSKTTKSRADCGVTTASPGLGDNPGLAFVRAGGLPGVEARGTRGSSDALPDSARSISLSPPHWLKVLLSSCIRRPSESRNPVSASLR